MRHLELFGKTDAASGLHFPDKSDSPAITAVLASNEILLFEIQHRIANSLQVIAGIALMKARAAKTEDARSHLEDLHHRVMLVAQVQRQLCSTGMTDQIEFSTYLAELCEGLAQSMVVNESVTIATICASGFIKADEAVSFGLIVSELVINALKHAFPEGRKGQVTVTFARYGKSWRLSVSDNGVGLPVDLLDVPSQGLGTKIVAALAQQLKATVETVATASGMKTIVTHRDGNTRVKSISGVALERRSAPRL